MNTDEFIKHCEATIQECLVILRSKNEDYAGYDDPFKNFNLARIAGVTREHGIAVRLMDKLSRIGTLLNAPGGPSVKEESIRDTIMDAINYLLILDASIEDSKNGQK